MNVSVTNTATHPTPKVSFNRIKNLVLGEKYDLSVVFIPPRKMHTLNNTYRHKNSSTDILAFPLSKTNGEIFLCMQDVKKKAKTFNMTTSDYLNFLVIHGMLHLEGRNHGRTMEMLERKYCLALKFPTPS
ncbi:rRNA maturation RNase YbeY [Patescibacteria group bacterium]|nr:MAG: rRNA maturation RNase YbeY [Patescibacteria group bacterium]